jgi:alpha-L-fucosidase
MVREMEPGVLFFSDAGPSLRWVGNERGVAGETNWNTLSPDTLFAGKPGITKLLNEGSPKGSDWIPAEVDVSIRPGWFYHAEEDSLVKTPEQLFDIYLTSVGRGSTLLLNVPPDRRGLIHERDLAALQGFKNMLDTEFGNNLATNAKVSASSFRGDDKAFSPANVADQDPETYWATDAEIARGYIEIDFGQPTSIKYVEIQEYIKLGQRIRGFKIEAFQQGEWKSIAEGTTIGYKRILRIEPTQTTKVRIKITDSRASPVISEIGVY